MEPSLNLVARTDRILLEGPHSRRKELWLVLRSVKDFIDWCNGPEGQKIVKDVGFVPLPKEGKTVASR